ncbi:hypothetical protein GCM10022403_096860 [Streptomyces coacervatus]|uniref:Double-GTPase 2 domain-containing protein n=1 Tax=Streptomyces coacervatus TaxID=647381 RepID=A0ABP7JPE3_9ACTN|nr:hypothetical protein [Streptomyces coacervatus]MDF2264060.1 hypothetical protein [Streptomyces coacervatus]
MTDVICPYCFARAAASALPYRCLSRGGGSVSRACDPVRDEVWEAFKGPAIGAQAAVRGPLFHPRRGLRPRGGRVPCPDCAVPTPTRVCKECHSDFPSDYCDQESRIIALVGAVSVGKSTCVTVLMHELRHRVGHTFRAAVAAMGGDTQTRDRDLERDLYDLGLMPDPTTTAARALNDPLLYRLSLPGGRRGTGTRHTALVFFDAAGEDLSGIEAMNRYTGYLAAADGIILLIDPLQLPSVREELSASGPLLPFEPAPQQRIAADVATQLRSHGRRGSGGRLHTPLAVALTKTDMVRPLLPAHSPLHANARHDDGVLHESDRLAVHEEVRSLLIGWDGGELCRRLDRDFSRVSYFGFSALGAPPPAGAPDKAPPGGPQPVRIEDPLLWLLAEQGLLPVRRTNRRTRGVAE